MLTNARCLSEGVDVPSLDAVIFVSAKNSQVDVVVFSTEEGRQDAKLEKIQEIPLSELHPFKNHPFKVKDDEAMMETWKLFMKTLSAVRNSTPLVNSYSLLA